MESFSVELIIARSFYRGLQSVCAVADRRSEMLLVTATLKLIIPQSGNILSLLK